MASDTLRKEPLYTYANVNVSLRAAMSYSFETLDDNHIIIMTMHDDFDMAQEIQAAIKEGHALVEALPAPLVYITDVRALHFSNLNELLEAANAVRFINPDERVSRHPKVLKSLAVISSRVIQAAAKGLNSVSFGHMEITMYPTLEETLVKARALLKDADPKDLEATA
jgi:hypothetical protein